MIIHVCIRAYMHMAYTHSSRCILLLPVPGRQGRPCLFWQLCTHLIQAPWPDDVPQGDPWLVGTPSWFIILYGNWRHADVSTSKLLVSMVISTISSFSGGFQMFHRCFLVLFSPEINASHNESPDQFWGNNYHNHASKRDINIFPSLNHVKLAFLDGFPRILIYARWVFRIDVRLQQDSSGGTGGMDSAALASWTILDDAEKGCFKDLAHWNIHHETDIEFEVPFFEAIHRLS